MGKAFELTGTLREYSTAQQDPASSKIMNMPNNASFDPAGEVYQNTRRAHWDAIARKRDEWQGMGKWYHQRLAELYRFHISPNLRVLELGCGDGRLLASIQPARGVGLDFSAEMLHRAREKYPQLF